MKKIITVIFLVVFLFIIDLNSVHAINISSGEDFVKWLCAENMNCASYEDNQVTLNENVNLAYEDEQGATIIKDLTLDLNGHTIKNISNGLINDYLIYSFANKFIIKDSSKEKNGKIITNTRGIISVQTGNLYIEGGTFDGIRDAAYTFGIYNGKMYFNDGIINSDNVGIHLYGSNSSVEINGGKINSGYDGIYTSGCMDECEANETITININDGNITGDDSSIKAFADLGNVFLNISGGKFDGGLAILEPKNNMKILLSGGDFQSEEGGAISFFSEEVVLNENDMLNVIADGFAISPSSIHKHSEIIDSVNYSIISTEHYVQILRKELIESENTEDIKENTEVTNPKTGDKSIMFIIGLLSLALIGGIVSIKNLKKLNKLNKSI